MPRRALVGFLVLAAGCIYGRSAEEAPARPRRMAATDLIPSGAQWIVYGDSTRFRGTPFARTLERVATEDDEIVPRLRRAEIDLVRDVDRFVVAGRFEEEIGVALLEHRMSADRVERFIDAVLTMEGEVVIREVVGGHPVRRTEDPPLAAVIVHEGLVAFCTRRALPALLQDLDDGPPRSADPLRDRFRRALEDPPTSHPPFLVVVAMETPPLPRVDEAVPDLPPPAALSAWASLEGGLEVHIIGRYPREDEARQIGGQLDELLELEGRVRAMATLMGLEPLFAGARVEVDGSQVAIRIRVSEADLQGMLARAELLVAE